MEAASDATGIIEVQGRLVEQIDPDVCPGFDEATRQILLAFIDPTGS